MKTYSRVYAKIDLDAIVNNVEQMHQRCSNGTAIMPVIKADGYGHGSVQIAEVLEQKEYIWGFAVATLDEALVLRAEGVKKPILVLGCVFPDQYSEMIHNDIRMNVYTVEMAMAISKLAGEIGKKAYMHIKIDTGMGRLGFEVNEASVDAIKRISEMDDVVMEGIFTHFAKADETDKAYTMMQLDRFKWICDALKNENVTFTYEHSANSAAIVDVPEADMAIVRAGISLYGLYPSEEVNKENLSLTPALSLKSHIAFVKEVEEGTHISYGGTFVADKKMKIATIPVGYADGYPRNLSNNGYVLIRGQKAPVVGRICMDQFMVDVSHIDGAKFGDKVTLIGTDGNETITVEELGELSGRFNYEFICDLGKRIPRVYVRNGVVSEQVDYFA